MPQIFSTTRINDQVYYITDYGYMTPTSYMNYVSDMDRNNI